MRLMRGSISTASMCPTPAESAAATSLPAARADDEHVVHRRLADAAQQFMRQYIRALEGADVVHVLVREVVDVDRAR